MYKLGKGMRITQTGRLSHCRFSGRRGPNTCYEQSEGYFSVEMKNTIFLLELQLFESHMSLEKMRLNV